MPSEPLHINASLCTQRMTLAVCVHGAWWLRCRTWLAARWCWIGALLIGCKFSIGSGKDDD